MQNNILTPKIIANEALLVLQSNLTMANLVHRDYSEEFVHIGDTITIRKPTNIFIGQMINQNETKGSIEVKINRFQYITIPITSRELMLDIKIFSEQIVAPAMQSIAQAIDSDLLAVGIENAAGKATISSIPVISDIKGVCKALDKAKAPRQNRCLILPPEILYKYNTIDKFSKKCYKGDSQALKEGEIGKVYTCETYMSLNCPENQSVKAGTVKSYKVTGKKGETQFTVSEGTAATATIKKGDQLIVKGYLYTATEDLTLAFGIGTLKVDQNILADVTAVSAYVVNKPHALGFHRNGIALVTRNLAFPMRAKESYIASADGLGVRVVFNYDSKVKTDTISFEIIYGIKELDKNLLVDFS